MSDIKLQKVILPPDVIDLSFGEPKVVMQALFRQLNRFGSPVFMPTLYDLPQWEYQPAAGKPDLVKILEEKHDARVVIANGAKQALAAAIYAFKQHGFSRVDYQRPYYPANPSLISSVGSSSSGQGTADCYISTSPNNPDGNYITSLEIINTRCKGPTIHDAAYYTEIYLPDNEIPLPLGDIQVFSISKMYGLSGLRVGYAVCHNEKYYQDMVDYIEMTTAGVSAASQDIVRNIEFFFQENPSYYKEFCQEARQAIKDARAELLLLDKDVLELMPCQSNSMFGWFKAGPALDYNAAKVYLLPGELFGTPGMIRMNIAHPPEIIREAVSRLNKSKIRF